MFIYPFVALNALFHLWYIGPIWPLVKATRHEWIHDDKIKSSLKGYLFSYFNFCQTTELFKCYIVHPLCAQTHIWLANVIFCKIMLHGITTNVNLNAAWSNWQLQITQSHVDLYIYLSYWSPHNHQKYIKIYDIRVFLQGTILKRIENEHQIHHNTEGEISDTFWEINRAWCKGCLGKFPSPFWHCFNFRLIPGAGV